MTAIAVAMLVSMLLASAVLGFVGLMHELTRSPRGRRWMRRRRYAIRRHVDATYWAGTRTLCAARRTLAAQLSRPAPVHLPPAAAPVARPVVSLPHRAVSTVTS
ncbi:hypothetical protein [Phytoactinopolyspora limicola]|uniref:hypothetical protein n=1 Tax=Phytoactinopolyspora limicola TaxID=2715536 RepID=UPI00140BD96D|nr:hypothetical protein [Phytoactinopolyspora limicola]